MLSIGKLGAGQEAYYTAKVAEGAEDYYSGRGEAEGYWLGSAAADLGLDGKVDPDALTAMLTGRHPATGVSLGLRHVPGRGPVPGFDLTFSAPKSVSLTWALGGDGAGAEVTAAHRASVAAALDYMEREACWTRRGHGGREFVHGNGFIATGYLHRSSRAGDPQLHTHVLVANATRGPDGRSTRLYHPAIYDHAKTAGYIYEANLRHELTRRLGVRWQEVANGIAEIEGFDPDHLRAFSTRRGGDPRRHRARRLRPRPPGRDAYDPEGQGPRPDRGEPERAVALDRRGDRARPRGDPPDLRSRSGGESGGDRRPRCGRGTDLARLPLRPPRRDPGGR